MPHKSKRKGRKSRNLSIKTLIKKTGWDIGYIQRVIAVKSELRKGDITAAADATKFSYETCKKVAQLERRNEKVVAAFELIVQNRSELHVKLKLISVPVRRQAQLLKSA